MTLSGSPAGTMPARTSGAIEGEEAGGVAAGVGDTGGGGQRIAAAGGDFGETVGPARIGAVRGRGIDDARGGILDQRDGLARGIVGQAQDHRVGGVERVGAGVGILAGVVGERDQGDVAAAGEPLVDLDAGGAGGAVDEHFNGHVRASAALRRRHRARRRCRAVRS